MSVSPEELKDSMRCWTTGVAIITSKLDREMQGMTVNSFISISIDPPLVAVTLANETRTKKLVDRSNIFGITILSADQENLSDRFSGRIPDGENRFTDIQYFYLDSGVPLITGGLAFLECNVIYKYPMKDSTLFIGEVQKTQNNFGPPLLYLNRQYRKIKD
ncbi:MAG: flavin reductase family protein [Anaerolineaceae bacterium]